MEYGRIPLAFLNSANVSLIRARTLRPEAFWVLIGQAGTAIAGLAGIKLLTHVLDPSEFGRLAIANTIVALIGANCFGPFGQGLMRFWAIAKDRGDLEVFCSVASRIGRMLTLVVLFVTVILTFFLSRVADFHWTLLVTLSLPVGAVTGLFSLKMGILTAARQRRRVAILKISNSLLRPLMAAFLVILTVSNANVALGAYLLAGLFLLLLVECFPSPSEYKTITHQSKPNTRTLLFRGLGKEILCYSWPFLVWGIFGWFYMSCDRWSLQIFYGPRTVGPFAVVSLLAAYPLNSGSTFLTDLFSPIAFQRARDLTDNTAVDSAFEILKVMTFIYVLGASLLVGFFALFHRPLVRLISNEAFGQFSYLLPGLATAWALFFLGQMLTQFGLLSKKPQVYVFPKLVASLIAGTATFYLSSKIGPPGVVWGLVLAGLIYAGWCVLINLRLLFFGDRSR